MRDLQEVLEEQTGFDLTGWTLTSAIEITPDGRTIVGTAIDPSGATEAWIAFIPEPRAASLLALGFGGLAVRRRVLVARFGVAVRTVQQGGPWMTDDTRERAAFDHGQAG